MKLSIIVPDGTVCQDNKCYTNLTWEGTPENVRVLQWDSENPVDITTKSVSEIVIDGEISINETSETNTYFGWIEFNDGSPNELITELPVWTANAKSAWDTAANPPPPPTPTPEEIAEQNKQQAKSLLAETDYVNEPDVIDPSRNPHLLNQAEFLTYREQIRKIAVNPPSFVIENWPVKPTNVWSS